MPSAPSRPLPGITRPHVPSVTPIPERYSPPPLQDPATQEERRCDGHDDPERLAPLELGLAMLTGPHVHRDLLEPEARLGDPKQRFDLRRLARVGPGEQLGRSRADGVHPAHRIMKRPPQPDGDGAPHECCPEPANTLEPIARRLVALASEVPGSHRDVAPAGADLLDQAPQL